MRYSNIMTVTNVPLELIDPPSPILRHFSETSVKFLEMVTQILDYDGCLQAPPARPREGGRFQLIDGYRRFKAHIRAGMSHMPLNIKDMDDKQYLAAQIACNVGHVETDIIDLARHLDRLRRLGDTEMTQAQLATMCKCSKSWVSNTLRLNHLLPHAKDMVRRGEISVGNATGLARIPIDEQHKYVTDARIMNTRDFAPVVAHAVNDYREAIRAGKLELLGVDNLQPRMRSMDSIESEMNSPTEVPLLLASTGLTNPVEVIKLTLQWAFRLDFITIEERKEKTLQEERIRLNDMERRRKDRKFLRDSG